jgi:hypothetical protein
MKFLLFLATALFPFTLAAQAPNISSFSPTSAASGATVIISGTDFINVTAVSFGGIAAASFTVVSDIQISAVVANGSSGNVAVTTDNGTDELGIFIYDNDPPTVVITSTAAQPTNVSPIPVTITFSESVTGFSIGDITVTNGTASGFAGSGTTYTANITPTAAGVVSVSVDADAATDEASNGNTTSNTLSRTYDNVAPSVTITSTAAQPTNVSPIPITITFSESVTDFLIGDITVTNGTASGFAGSGTTYTANITPTAAGVVTISVAANVATDAAGNGNTSGESQFTYAPNITSFSPASGIVGTSVIINGTGFSTTPANNVVTINGITAIVTAASGTSITTSVPSGVTAGASPITVTVGGQLATSVTNFTVLPTLSGFAPTSAAIGATITISGTGFSSTPANNTVKFNNNITATVTASTTTSITTTVPIGTSNGTILVTVGGQNATSVSSFTVLPSPVITSITPTSGAVGSIVTINGDNFSTTAAQNVVRFNGVDAIVTASNPNAKRLTVVVPAGATTGPVTVTLNGVTVSSPTNFTVLPTPIITEFSPTSGAVGATVIITGTDFSASPVVAFGGISATVSASTSTSITTTVPVGATSGPISITTSGVTITSATNFTVLPAPTITGFSPGSGAVGATINISGTNFNTTPSQNVVRFNGTLATVTASTATSITAVVPAGATSGLLSLTVSGITISSATNFTVLQTPTITSFSPSAGAIGASVTITGTNFSASPTVFFNGISASVTTSNSTSITANIPVGATTGPISITTSGVTISSASNFTILPTPIIESFSPTSGAVGVSVTINGIDFSSNPDDQVVKFNTTTAVVSASTATNITTSVPAGATTGKISVTLNGVTIASENNFTVLATPSITSISPGSGAEGAVIILSGSNFSATPSDNVVSFNGTAAVVTASTTTTITTSVPVGASTGPISLTLNGVTINSSNFVVLPTPAISSFTPDSGAPGTLVTINGTDFGASPIVKFNGTVATVTASDATSITTSVPSGATTGAISVTSSGITITSATNFTVLALPTITSFTPISGAVGAVITINGTNFSINPTDNIITFNNTIANVTNATANAITTTVPEGATSGQISITLNGVTVNSTNNFTVLGTPTITALSTSSGAVGAILTITGTNFNTTPTVSFNGTSAIVNSFTTSSIVTSVPVGALTGPISITVNGVTVPSGSNFTVLASPSITGISPTNGAVGAVVTLSGTNLLTTPTVSFNGTAAALTSFTTNSVATTVPAGASSGPITLNVNGVTITSEVFTVLPTPGISGFTPSGAAVGASITINGNNFGPSPIVLFNDVSATVTSSTASSIVALVPNGATTGKISVTTSGITILSSANFNVLATPTISNFTPGSGAVGASVIISGTNFSASPTVKFNGITAVVSSANATSITTTVPAGATTGPISITTSGITVASLSDFTVLATPSITGFNPTSGAVGATVVVAGTNFSSIPLDQVVKFNNTIATVTSSTESSLTTTVPDGATSGKISVIVNGVTVQSANNFNVLASPTITGFAPTEAGVGATVTITGTNFISTPIVEFNGTPAIVSSFNSTSITTSVPLGAGTGHITVSLSGVIVTSATNFTVFGTPSISNFSPTNGGVGVPVTITGTNFSSVPAENIVKFNGVVAVVTASTSTSITTSVPAGATTGPISVTINGITGNSAGNFTVPVPTISNFTPVSAATGADIIITGVNFSATPGNNTVRFNGVVANVKSSTTTSITAVVPAGATTGVISIAVSGITGTSTTDFIVLPSPTLTGFNPSAGAVGAMVTINGTNFSTTPSNHLVKFNGTTAVVSASSSNSITTLVPSSATTGKISVTVSGVTLLSANDFTVLGTPAITNFNPSSGAVGAAILITGINFSSTPSDNIVLFNNQVATITASSSNSITTIVPVGATSGKISITVSGVTILSTNNFTVLDSPAFTSFNPDQGAVGSLVTLSGTNFSTTSSNNAVTFNGTPAIVTSSTNTSLATTVPAGATSGLISITVGGVTLTSASNFTVLPTPSIDGFSPAQGAESATVTISGTNFNSTASNNLVRFNGVLAEVITSTSTSIVTKVPVGASTGKIAITTSGVTIFSQNNFIVAPKPTITSFSPTEGTAGTLVNITGSNFDSDEPKNLVTFNGKNALVIAASPTIITTSVPNDATTGPISVTVNGVTVTTSSNFTVLTVDSTPPILDVNNTPTEVSSGESLLISAIFSDPESEVTGASVTFQSVTKRGDLITASLTKFGSNWEFRIPAVLIGELGIEYQLSATNSKGLVYTSASFNLVKVAFPGQGLTIPYASFGSDISKYKIISIPLDLNQPTVANVFDELPPYDKTKWRLSHYDNTSNTNNELTETSSILPGLGYWLLIKDNPNIAITTGAGKTVEINQPFQITLKAGWNQIGNPYNFDLSWNDVVEANPGLPLSLRGFNGSIKNFENKNTLTKMEGGFVNVATDMPLFFPVKKTINGRNESSSSSLKNSLDQPEWDIDFTIEQGDIANVIGGLGMRLKASEGFDIYDGFSMPRFNQFLEINHHKKLNQYHYSKDIIPTVESHTWNFKVEASTSDKLATIKWNNQYLGTNEFNLILFDEQTKVWVDMKQHQSYSFTPPSNFKVIYGSSKDVSKEIGLANAQIIEVSPNPSRGPINIHLFLPEWQKTYPVQIDLKSLKGITLATIFDGELSSGYQQMNWTGESNSSPLPAGVYLIQMRCNDTIQTVRLLWLN